MAAPISAEAARHDPEEAVVPAQAGPSAGAQRGRELLPQKQVLHCGRVAAPDRREHDTDEE